MGAIDVLEHEIKLKPDAVPYRARPFRLSPLEPECLKKELDKFLRLGIIKKSTHSEWSANIVMIRKKDNTYRVTVDYRKLNLACQRDAYTNVLPRIDDLLDKLGHANWFSTIDLRQGFHQLALSEDSMHLTNFTCKFGSFVYTRTPMGLQSSPGVFMRAINIIFQELIDVSCLCYLDDVTSYSSGTELDHFNAVKNMFACAKKGGLKLNPTKCHFFKKKVNFLGFVISEKGVEQSSLLTDKVSLFPVPKNKKQVRSFIGLASYYRRFIQNFAMICRPLHDLTKGIGERIEWSNKANTAFLTLKQKLVEAPILVRPDFSRPFIIITDASIDGLGAVLTQLDENNHEHPIFYASSATTVGQRNYGISKLEMAAVVWALRLFRPYVLSNEFPVTIITDHAALKSFLKHKNPSGILARWIEELSEYPQLVWQYRPGRVNQSADALSRLGH
jgi:hypothetical protein